MGYAWMVHGGPSEYKTMKTRLASVLFVSLAACGTGASQVKTTGTDEPVVVAGVPVPEEQPPVAAQEPPTQQAPDQDSNVVVAQQPNVAATPDPNDTNPDKLQVDPVTGKYDYRYGGWTAGVVGIPSYEPCGRIHGAVLLFHQVNGVWRVQGTEDEVTFGPEGSVSWVWSATGNTETWSTDGKGTYVFAAESLACPISIQR